MGEIMMKKLLYILMGIALLLVGCAREFEPDFVQEEDNGGIVLELVPEEALTRAGKDGVKDGVTEYNENLISGKVHLFFYANNATDDTPALKSVYADVNPTTRKVSLSTSVAEVRALFGGTNSGRKCKVFVIANYNGTTEINHESTPRYTRNQLKALVLATPTWKDICDGNGQFTPSETPAFVMTGEAEIESRGATASPVVDGEVQMARVVTPERRGSDNHMSLVCILLSEDVKIPACGDANLRVRRWQFPRAALGIAARGVFSHRTEHFFRLHIAQHIKHHPVGMIKAPGEAMQVAGTELPKRFGIAQNVASEGMRREDKALELVVDELRRLVLIALYLVDDHFHLAVHLFLRIGALHSDVEQEVDGPRNMLLQASAIIDRLLFACKRIEFSAHALHARDDLPSRATAGPFERHMLDEMGHSALFGQFVASAGIDGDAQVHHIRLSRSADKPEAAWKSVSCEHIKIKGGKQSLLPASLLI